MTTSIKERIIEERKRLRKLLMFKSVYHIIRETAVSSNLSPKMTKLYIYILIEEISNELYLLFLKRRIKDSLHMFQA